MRIKNCKMGLYITPNGDCKINLQFKGADAIEGTEVELYELGRHLQWGLTGTACQIDLIVRHKIDTDTPEG